MSAHNQSHKSTTGHTTAQTRKLTQSARLTEQGYVCQDGIWYKVFKSETPKGAAQDMRLTDQGYSCQNGMWYKCVDADNQS